MKIYSIKSFISKRKKLIIFGALLLVMQYLSAVLSIQFIKMCFLISDAYLLLIFIGECKKTISTKKPSDVRALFIYSSAFYIMQLIGMDIISRISDSEVIVYYTLNHSKVFPVLLFLLVVVTTIVNKMIIRK